MSLDRYRERHDPRRTPEPEGRSVGGRSGAPAFVIHHHDASTDHYDLRLESDGALLSWAVPKGPSTDPRAKRLAVRTEDHPLDYADFEGVIPEGEYGAGTAMVWDRGTWENLSGEEGARIPPAEALEEGHLAFRLHGEKIRGGYALHRMDGDDWLLVKMDDDAADARRNPVSTEPRSVRTGRTMAEIAEDDAPEEP